MAVQVIPIPIDLVSHSLPFPFLCFILIPVGFPLPLGIPFPCTSLLWNRNVPSVSSPETMQFRPLQFFWHHNFPPTVRPLCCQKPLRVPSLACQWRRCPVTGTLTTATLGTKGWSKNGTTFLYDLTSSKTDQFLNSFHCQNLENICNNTVSKDPTTPQVCRHTTMRNVSVLKATIENKTTSLTTHFKKSTTGNNVFIVSVII